MKKIYVLISIAIMLAMFALPSVQGNESYDYQIGEAFKVERLKGGGPKMSTVTMDYSMTENGQLYAKIKNNGLSSVKIEIYDITDGSPILEMSEKIKISGDKTGIFTSSRLEVSAGNEYRIVVIPGGIPGNYVTIAPWQRSAIPPDNPYIQISPDPAFIGQQVIYDGSATINLIGMGIYYVWDFGDGATGYGIISTHIYSMQGTYAVTLTVVDANYQSYDFAEMFEVKSIFPT